MLLDNQNKKAIQWIEQDTAEGSMDIVTGYFTVGALVWLSEHTNSLIREYRYILGDIVNTGSSADRPLDLLNETLGISEAMDLHKKATEAVKFLKLDKVSLKTLEPNFCHAKLFLNRAASGKDNEGYFITGSSNLTEAGLGMRTLHNVELNIGGHPSSPDYKGLAEWFESLWTSPQAYSVKTIEDEKGKKAKKDFKQYLIDEISRIFNEYSPEELYYKVLFELFGEQLLGELNDPELNRQIGKLQNTHIYKDCYPFQQQGILGLIRMLQKYRGAILADAVGLGKTWSALAVMKYYQMQGYRVVLFCPKKLEHNWRMYLKDQDSRFEEDKFDFIMRAHTDLRAELMDRKTDVQDKRFRKSRPRLFVIDESHNLRNDKSARYQFLVEEILKYNDNARVLLLSATPINNTFNDVRNQFKLLVQGRNDGFAESLDVRNLESAFRTATREFRLWSSTPGSHISNLIQKLPSHFLHLTDSLILARTRKMIRGQEAGLHFPKKAKPDNYWITPKYIGNYETFDELFVDFPPLLSGYQPARYTQQAAEVKKTQDEQQRQFFLAKMMYILMVKRLESSWSAFHSTVRTIEAHHQEALNRILAFEEGARDAELNADPQGTLFGEDDEDEQEWERLSLGKKTPIRLSQIAAAGMLSAYKADLKKDIQAFSKLMHNLELFSKKIGAETAGKPSAKSGDTKLEKLMELIRAKQKSGANRDNKKVLIFTTYADTASYLYHQLAARGFGNVASVSGSGASTEADGHTGPRSIEAILERFSPFTKLFREKDWKGWTASNENLTPAAQFEEWKAWVIGDHPDVAQKLAAPIDILIATDVLSEGQNLQDCDTVVNYDIHWNPVRIIQRMGRVDRLGSPNDTVRGINFWPSDNINAYLNLQSRIEQRMAAMKLAGAEVESELTDTFRQMADDEDLERRQTARMMEHMQTSWEDIGESADSLGFNDLSLETFRQELAAMLDKDKDKYRLMPRGVYTGFALTGAGAFMAPAMIALLGYPARKAGAGYAPYASHELICIDASGKPVLGNQKEVLDALSLHKGARRQVPKAIDEGDATAITQWSRALLQWIKSQAATEIVAEDGTTKEVAGASSLDLIKKLQSGSAKAITAVKDGETISGQYKPEAFDLITWFIVSPYEAS